MSGDENVTEALRERGASASSPRLIVIEGAGAGTSYTLEGRVSVIGRDPDASICIDEPGVSRRHAELTRTGLGVIVEDLESRNGTKVNGKPVVRRLLVDNDLIRIGSVEFKYIGPG